MLSPNQILGRIQGIRQLQPSAIRNSILMAIIQLASFIGAFVLIGLSVLQFVNASRPIPKKFFSINTMLNTHLSMSKETEYAVAYMLLFASLLLLLIWKLTRMVRRRNAYILSINWAMDDEDE